MTKKFPNLPHLTSAALAAGVLCACAALVLSWPLPTVGGEQSYVIAIPIAASMAGLLLLCLVALAALEYGIWPAALPVAGGVAILITATIASWVLMLAPPFGIALFGVGNDPAAPAAGFPSATARNAAIAVALASLAPLLLTTRVYQNLKRPLAWAAGLLLVVGPVLAVHGIYDLAEFLAWAAALCMGIALLSSRHTRATVDGKRYADWGARTRAFVVVAVIALTLILWHAVRAAEIRQLQSEVDSAARMAVEEWRNSITDRIRSTDRLRMHWEALGWNVADSVYLADSQNFMRDYPGIHALLITDAQGRILKIALRDIQIGAQPSDRDRVALARADGLPAGVAQRASTAALAAIAALSRIRTREPDTINGVELIQSAAPAFDGAGRPVGAMVLVFRRDINDTLLLANAAPDFNLRVFTNGVLTYNRPAHDENLETAEAVARSGYPFNATQQVQLNFNDYVFELTPGRRAFERSLTGVPGLVLVFAWVALLLLMFALHNERRAYTLARDRERILNESLDLICTLDANGRYVTVNARSLAVLGYTPEEMIGKHYSEFAHPDERPALAKQWDEAQRGIPLPSMPLRFVDKHGSTVYLQGNAHWSQQERLFFCDMRDVSEQHALELARKHAADTLDAGVEQAGCVVYELDYDTQSINWVGAAAALTGYTAEELHRAGFDGWMAAIHPDHREHVRDTFKRCFATRQPHSIDYRLRRKDGDYIPVLDRGRYIHDGTNTQPRMIGALIDLTAIRQQELALRRSEERYRIIATQVGALILERDVRTGLSRIFGPVERIFGFTKEQVEGRPMPLDDTMVHPDDRARVSATFEEAEKKLSNFYVEYRRRHRGGHYIHIAARGVVLPGADGKAERSVVAITDITERKQSEERLLESEERFRLAAEQARQIVYEFTYNEQMEIESMRFAGATDALLGYDMQEFSAIHRDGHLVLFHPEDLPIARTLPAATVNQVGNFQVEHRLRHRDGHYVYVENRAAARRDANGNLIAIVGMLLDISARKAAEAQRQTYTDQLGKLADIARTVSTQLSVYDLLDFLARSMRELTRASAAAAVVHATTAGEEEAATVARSEEDTPQRGASAGLGSEEMYALLHGASQPVRLTAEQIAAYGVHGPHTNDKPPLRSWLAAPLVGRDGVRLGLLEMTDKIDGDFTDSDAQVLSQLAGLASVALENIRLYATLEERVAARTRELQLSNRELEAFSYSVSHDLRAPLRAIAGFSSILEQEYAGKLDTGARRYIQRIGHGVERMANLIDDLLSLARVSRLELKRESVDLTALSKTIVKRHVERWPDRAIQIKIDPRMRAEADPRLVEVALENLVENAIKFSGTREQAQVHIGKRSANGHATFFVRDNGVGFDPEYAANLFGVFQRLHSASEFPGTGVGLATVQRIVQRHRGRVWAESQLNEGATFYFTFDSEA